VTASPCRTLMLAKVGCAFLVLMLILSMEPCLLSLTFSLCGRLSKIRSPAKSVGSFRLFNTALIKLLPVISYTIPLFKHLRNPAKLQVIACK